MGMPNGRPTLQRASGQGAIWLATNKGLNRMILRTALAATLIGAAVLSTAASAKAGSLGHAEITRLFPGQFEAQVKGYRVNFSGASNGAIAGSAYGQQDKGRWYVKGSSLCVSFDKWTKGKARCGEISQKGGWYVASSNDGEVLKFRRTDLAQN